MLQSELFSSRSDWRCLQIDHINGDGPREEKSSYTSYIYRVIRSVEADEHKYQLLCANCNWIKKYDQNENPNKGGVKRRPN